MEDLTPIQKAQLHEVADAMLELYHTFARMRYLDYSWITEGPHDMDTLLPACRSVGLDASIIYLYSILPYVSTDGTQDVEFVMGGKFADFRLEYLITQGRDPVHTGLESAVVRPWMTALSLEHASDGAIIYDARKHCIAMRLGGEDPVATDDYDDLQSRPAGDVLRAIIRAYHELMATPGGGPVSGPEWRESLVKPLYRKHGWPRADFDGDAFLIDQARAAAAWVAAEEAAEQMQVVCELKDGQLGHERRTMWQFRDRIAAARTVDEEWLERWRLLQAEQWQRRATRNMRDAAAEVDRLCPSGRFQNPEELLLCELRILQVELWNWRREVEGVRLDVGWRKQVGGDDVVPPRLRIHLAYLEKREATYQRAYAACQADAALACPGRTLPIGRGLKTLGVDLDALMRFYAALAKDDELAVETVRAWMLRLPDGAHRARGEARAALECLEQTVPFRRGQCREVARQLEEQ